MTVPVYAVEVGWDNQTPTAIVGTCTVGGALAVVLGEWGGYIWSSIYDDVKSIEIRRGRSSDLAYMDQGRCMIRLRDTDGTYNPENASSSLADKLDVMRPLRITATYGGSTYGLFYGYIWDIAHDPGHYEQESIIVAVDFLEWLTRSKQSIVIAEVTNERVDQLIGRILNAIEWTEPSMRSFDVSSTTVPSWSADGTKSPLELMQDLLAVDRGVFFVDGRGRTCYRSRDIHYQGSTPVDTFTSAQIARLRASISAVDIVNSITVTKTDGVAQTATDAASRARYGYRDGLAITSDYLADDNHAEDLAQFLIRLQKNPRIPARELSLINGDATRLVSQLAREIGDLVTINEAQGGTNFVGRVQAVEHDISEAFTVHRTRFLVQKVELVPFIVGSSTVGSAHVVVY